MKFMSIKKNGKHVKCNNNSILIKKYIRILVVLEILAVTILLKYAFSKYVLPSQVVTVQVSFNELYYENVESEEKYFTLQEAINATGNGDNGNEIRVINNVARRGNYIYSKY